jgi:hypothetical protein
MSRIDRVYVAAHRSDLRLTRICIASIRRWYSDIPLFLLKDRVNGDFSTQELEEKWNVRCWPTENAAFGWGFVKLEPLFSRERCRYLVLDSDIVFLGPVIDELEKSSADFVVQREVQPDSDVAPLYFDEKMLRESIDPHFAGLSFTFNSGQYVATSGLLTRKDFDAVIEWTSPRRVRHPEMFNPGDQGILNYVVLCKLAAGAITVDRVPFMRWGKEETTEFVLHELNEGSRHPYLIHWAGLKKLRLRHMLRADILTHFEDSYYSRIDFGRLVLWFRITQSEAERWGKRLSRKWKQAIQLVSRYHGRGIAP